MSAEEFAAAEALLSDAQRAAILTAAANIETFHRPQLPRAFAVNTARGVRCERVIRPIESVGLYVPAGNAPLPSTALMLGVPARIAGCAIRILCSPVQATGASTRQCFTRHESPVSSACSSSAARKP